MAKYIQDNYVFINIHWNWLRYEVASILIQTAEQPMTVCRFLLCPCQTVRRITHHKKNPSFLHLPAATILCCLCLHFFFQSKKSIFGFNIVESKYNLGDLEEHGKSTFPYMMGMKQPEDSYSLFTVIHFCDPPSGLCQSAGCYWRLDNWKGNVKY